MTVGDLATWLDTRYRPPRYRVVRVVEESGPGHVVIEITDQPRCRVDRFELQPIESGPVTHPGQLTIDEVA